MPRLWIAAAITLLLLVGGLTSASGPFELPLFGEPAEGMTPPFVTSGASLRLIP